MIAAWLLMAVLVPTGFASADDNVLKLEKAEFIRSDSETPPPDSEPWEAIALPDRWTVRRFGASGFAWYQLRFSLEQVPSHQQAIYLRAFTTGIVYLNGYWVGETGSIEEPLFGQPGLYVLRPELLQAGTNTVHVRLWVKPTWDGHLSTIRLGDAVPMMEAKERDVIMTITVPQLVGVFSVTIGLYMLLIWVQRRRDTMYAYFALAAIVFAIWASPWLTWVVFETPGELLTALVRFKATFLFMCFLRLAGWRWPRAERVIWLVTMLCASADIANFFLDRSNEFVVHATRIANLPINGATTALALWMGWRLRTPESLVLATAQTLSFGMVVLWGFLWFLPVPREGWPDLGYLNIVPIFLAMGWILTRRFARSLDDAERLNADLEQRVAQKHAELQRNYLQLEQMTRQAAVAEERRRIMTDMHDGIGGQLISTLNLVKHGTSTKDVEAALQECLDDLRLIIDSLQPTDDDLLPVLGNLRYRLEGRLQKQGITLDWQVREVPKLSCLTPQNVLQVLRILQEAFTNILKHAQASRISVGTSVESGHVSIRVSDNGRGFNESQSAGHGLSNMHARARRIGGVLEVTPSAGGTTLALSLPIG